MSFFQDLHHGWRNLSRTPTFLLVAVASLALGIGANTALFSVLYAALFKNLPIDDPQLLVLFNDPNSEGVGIGSSNGERGLLTWQEFQQLHEVKAIDGLFATQSFLPRMTVRIGVSEEEASGKLVSGAYFSVLHLRPPMGQFFDESTDRQINAAPFVVLSDAYFSRRFNRDPSVIGKTMAVEKTPLTIVGIAPRGFSGESVGRNPDFWVPLAMAKAVMRGRDFLSQPPDPTLKIMWLHVFGRLRLGANIAQAQAQADVVFKASLQESYAGLSANAKKAFMDQRLKLRPAATGASGMRRDFSESMYVIFAAVGVTLLICCANLSNLLLARANKRNREITVRLALGASKGRIARQLITEGLLLSLLGAAAGLMLSQALAPVLMRMASNSRNTVYLDASIDWRVLSFTAAVALLTTLLCSFVPAIRASRTQLNSSLREGSRGMTASHSRLSAGRLFVAAQVALSLLLLVGAGLFLRSLLNLERVDLGYKRERLVLLDVQPVGSATSEKRAQLYRQVFARLRNTPGVESVTFSGNGLFSGSESGDQIEVEGYTATGKDDRGSRFDNIGPHYFSALGIPMLAGREIDDRDSPSGLTVAVINEAFAKQFFANRNPIGKHVIDRYGDQRTPFEIVGVARDSRDHSLRDKIPPRVFVSLLQAKFGNEVPSGAEYEVRARGDARFALNVLLKQVKSEDADAHVEAQLLERNLDDRLSGDKVIANLLTVFGALALSLAAVGIYGVLAYSVSQRTSEIGIRMAIGAEARDVVAMIVRETGWMVAAGLAAGLVAAYFLTKIIASKLFGVAPADPGVLGVAIGTLAAIALLAALVPAWRAARIDPANALRYE